ncbi:MAG: ABC transporter permease, partial [Alphaproteobacteria bacterium]
MAEPARQGRRRNLPLAIGGTLLAAYAAIAVLAPWIAPQDPNAQDLLAVLERPSAEHWLGTDQIGRDLLSRLVVGTRFTLAAALLSVAIAGVVGVTLGLLAGYSGGR